MLACTAPTDRSFWRQDHKDALPQGWGITVWVNVNRTSKNPPHPLIVYYRYYTPTGGKYFKGLAAAKVAANAAAKAAATNSSAASSSSSSSRKPDASKRSSSSLPPPPAPKKARGAEEQEREEDGGSLHSRHPWFKKWLEDGRNAADLLPEQYPKGYDPKRNESK